ncbi:MAG TPA: hypothetical protein VMA35_03830, partial [Candidatus Sulfopaludibacter sp.]|nr:hypothetical protein [Candidatus Sulfopaludibacter sp.]
MNIPVKLRRICLWVLPMVLTLTAVPGRAQTCTVNWANQHQRIDGFGASSAFTGFTWTTSMADMFFSTNNGTGLSKNSTNFTFTGVGLSLLRNQVQPPANTSGIAYANANEINLMQMAQARGARVWSSPWSPPTFCKNTNTLNGGSYNGIGGNLTNQLYAQELAGYVANMENTYHVNIYALSIQNEPDVSTTYASCLWTAQQYHDFVTNLYPAMVASNVASTLIMLPEDEHWATTYYTTAMTDPSVAADVGIIADHNYDGPNFQTGSTTPPAALNSYGKALWETEVSTGDSPNGSISNAVYWAQRIYLFMTVAQANAWHYWWLINLNSDNEGLADNNYVPTKRMYALGQFSRFVRPGYYRIDASSTGTALISAFDDTNSGTFAIVAINTNATTAISQTFNLSNFPGTVSSVTPWITSATMSLSNQTPVAVSSSSFGYTLPALSVVTFVGQVVANTSTPPTLTPVADQTMNAGQTLLVTNTASDPNVPPQTLTFNLLNGPSGATLTTLDATDAQFSWRAPVNSAGTTNPVTVTVTDNGTLLSATNSFNVIVNPLTSQPAVSSIGTTGGLVMLVLNGPQGPDYTVLTTTNLTDPVSAWQVLLTTNSPATPVTLTVPMTADPVRFYTIQIGP